MHSGNRKRWRQRGPRQSTPLCHWEIQGRFHKRVVLANIPSFRFSFWGTCERTLVPVFIPGEHPNVPSFRFSFRGSTLVENRPFVNPRLLTIRTRYGNSVSTPEATRTCKTQQNVTYNCTHQQEGHHIPCCCLLDALLTIPFTTVFVSIRFLMWKPDVHMSNDIFLRTRQKQKCTTSV